MSEAPIHPDAENFKANPEAVAAELRGGGATVVELDEHRKAASTDVDSIGPEGKLISKFVKGEEAEIHVLDGSDPKEVKELVEWYAGVLERPDLKAEDVRNLLHDAVAQGLISYNKEGHAQSLVNPKTHRPFAGIKEFSEAARAKEDELLRSEGQVRPRTKAEREAAEAALASTEEFQPVTADSVEPNLPAAPTTVEIRDQAHEAALKENEARDKVELAMLKMQQAEAEKTYADNIAAGENIDRSRSDAKQEAARKDELMAEFWEKEGKPHLAREFRAQSEVQADQADEKFTKELSEKWSRESSDRKEIDAYLKSVSEAALKQEGYKQLALPKEKERAEVMRAQYHKELGLNVEPSSIRTRGNRLKGNKVVDIFYQSSEPMFKDVAFIETRSAITNELLDIRAIASKEPVRKSGKLSKWRGDVRPSKQVQRELDESLKAQPETYKAGIYDRTFGYQSEYSAIITGMRADGYEAHKQVPKRLKKRRQTLLEKLFNI